MINRFINRVNKLQKYKFLFIKTNNNCLIHKKCLILPLTMKFITKYLGVIIVLIGVLYLAIPFFLKLQTNKSLLIGLALVIVGFITYIILYKRYN